MMPDQSSDPIMLSAIEHYSYCPRQCALIHIEHVWDENVFTMRGRHVHENVHEESSNEVDGVRCERGLPLFSRRLNVVGKADLVEFHDNVPYPVEYKSGRRRAGHHEELQLCAQAVCLEEMLGVAVPKGALYWHGSRKRKEVLLTDAMRAEMERIVAAIHAMMASRIVPPPVNDKRCPDCSLKEACMPGVIAEQSHSRKAAKELFVVK